MPCSQLRFLVVEDHEFQRAMLVQLLRTLGAQAVHSAEDGRTALEVLRNLNESVDIVISDLSMPGMDGMEFIRHLSESGARVSLIIASAVELPLLASIANMAQAYRIRLLGAVAKPVAAVKLTPLVELHRSLEREQPAPDAVFSLGEIAEAWTHDEIAPWFEPCVDLEGGTVRAMHAAPRWQHPTRGLLEPRDFMPSVQARGLQDDFAWMMLHKCAVQCRSWRDSGRDLPIHVHLGMQNLADVKLAGRIRQTVEAEGLAPELLVLGVDEAALNTREPRLLENLARLRMDGFGLALDDFGSGAMDLDQLALVSFTEVKIRSSFVANAPGDGAARAGLAVGLDLARQLKLAAIADGISSKEEWTLLHDWGCHFGTGPFISAPLAPAAVPAWMARWKGSTIR